MTMRVVHICKNFGVLSETFIYNLVCNLERADSVESHVITGRYLNRPTFPFPSVTVIREPVAQRVLFAIRKKLRGRYVYRIDAMAYRTRLEALKPDVLIAHYGGTAQAVHRLAAGLGIPLVVIFHAFDLYRKVFPPDSYRTLWETPGKAIAISELGRQTLVEKFGCPADRVELIHCGVDVEQFATGFRPRTPRPDGAVRLITVSRLKEKKGIDVLLEALRSVREHNAGVTLTICGDGPLRRRLERLAAALGLRNAVSFLGGVPYDRIPALLGEHDVFVLASRTARNGDMEGLPISLLEAQASGMPLVSTRHSGIPEAVAPESRRYLAAENDPVELAQAIGKVIAEQDRWPAIAIAGRDHVTSRFGVGLERDSFLRVLDGITGGTFGRQPTEVEARPKAASDYRGKGNAL